MISGALLGILPMAAMLLGAAGELVRPQRQGASAALLSLVAVSVYFGALLLFAVSTPYYSTAKSFRALGLLPCYGLLAAARLEPLLRCPWSRALTWGLLSSWAIASYGAYFVVS